MTYTDHLSPTRARISSAWQFAGVCSSSAGRVMALFFAIGYSEVSRARSRAFFFAANEPHRLLIVTNSNLHRPGERHHGYVRNGSTDTEHRTAGRASHRRPAHGRARSAEVVWMVRWLRSPRDRRRHD